MNSHDLANLLLTLPNLPISTFANDHVYSSGVESKTHGSLKIGLLNHYNKDHIVIGNISKLNINKPNWFITEMYHGSAPEEWKSY
ncbi:MAG: hypothetical protein ACD_33C00002G0016 [uncultured bacterium]|nr:MAG: hypothetical protein ACD_33C00002G0016 [uncultured bacterium]